MKRSAEFSQYSDEEIEAHIRDVLRDASWTLRIVVNLVPEEGKETMLNRWLMHAGVAAIMRHSARQVSPELDEGLERMQKIMNRLVPELLDKEKRPRRTEG